MTNWDEEYERARAEKEFWQIFEQSPGWNRLKKILEVQFKARRNAPAMPVGSFEAMCAHNVRVGEAVGLEMAILLVQTLIEEAQNEEEWAKNQQKGGSDE